MFRGVDLKLTAQPSIVSGLLILRFCYLTCGPTVHIASHIAMATPLLTHDPPILVPKQALTHKAQIWDPVAVLDIYNAECDGTFTCPSRTPSRKRCKNIATQRNIVKAVELVKELSYANPADIGIETKLQEIAVLTLCKNVHREQSENRDQVVTRWMSSVRLAVMAICRNHQRVPTKSLIELNGKSNPKVETQIVKGTVNTSKDACGECTYRTPKDEIGLSKGSVAFGGNKKEHKRLESAIKERDKKLMQLRQELKEQREAFGRERREWQAEREQDSIEQREALDREHQEWQAERERDSMERFREQEASQKQRHNDLRRELLEAFGTDRSAKFQPEPDLPGELRGHFSEQQEYSDKLQQEKDANQKLQDLLDEKEAQFQRVKQRLNQSQENARLLQEHCCCLQGELQRAHRELARQFKDSSITDDIPRAATPSPPRGRLRDRIARIF